MTKTQIAALLGGAPSDWTEPASDWDFIQELGKRSNEKWFTNEKLDKLVLVGPKGKGLAIIRSFSLSWACDN